VGQKSKMNSDQNANGCTPEQLCVRCSMMKVITHRFRIFRQTFGREPLPTEPLFFEAHAERPVAAKQQELNAQLAEAAEQADVSLFKIRDFLGIEDPYSDRNAAS
jgi:hypothetical protein